MPETRPHSRSRSPRRSHPHHSQRRRSRSAERSRSHRHHHPAQHRSSNHGSAKPLTALENPYARLLVLPYKAVNLTKRDLPAYTAMFASYLDIQKQIVLEELDDREVQGRWKRFCGKWNRGELAEGWYDPVTKEKADAYAAENPNATSDPPQRRGSPDYNKSAEDAPPVDVDSDDYGPTPAPPSTLSKRPGASNPSFADLVERDESRASDSALARADLRHERAADRKAQKAALDDLVPRAEPGTRERQLEKRREVGAANREFRDARGGGEVEVPEGELLGGDEGVKRMRKEEERKKNERELRREEILRARATEREERLTGLREKEEKTMEMLRALAKERFGAGGVQ